MGHIQYYEKYFDDTFKYRHVLLPPEVTKLLPKNRLLSESEWRAIGVQQSRGWVHYAIHRPEPHIMLFRRPRNFQRSRVEDECTMQNFQIQYSEKYFDDTFEYRHVLLPPEVTKLLPKNRLLSESEWRAIGVQKSRGWVHYAIYPPEPHIMLFRRPRNFQSSRVEDGCTMQFNEQSYTICSVGGLTLSRIKKSKLKSAKPSC